MAALPKWTDERTDELTAFVGDETPVSQATVAEAADRFETSARSVSSKLRKMGFDVELASAAGGSKFTEEQAANLRLIVEENSGALTYAEIAEQLGQGFSAKQVQGKILSMELTSHVRPTPKVETPRTYSEDEEARFVELCNDGAFIEDLAAEFDRPVASVRGKALSLMRAGQIDAIPRQRETKGSAKVDAFEQLGDVSGMTVEEIAEALGKTARGVKTMLTRRGVAVADYDGAARKAKAAG